MKKLLTIIMFTFSSHFLFAQSTWVQLTSGTNQGLQRVFFTNANTGYVAGGCGSGYCGLILKTTDAGNSWSQIFSGSGEYDGLIFPSDNVGYASAWDGSVVKTTNAGLNWTTYSVYPSSHLSDIYPTSNNTVYTVGFNGSIFKTTDGGSNWIPYPTGLSQVLSGVFFVDANTGYICGSYYSGFGTVLLKTTNAGNNWTAYPFSFYSFNKVFFISPAVGFAVGLLTQSTAAIWKTTDGGISWIQKLTESIGELQNVFFYDSNNGCVVGRYGLIYRTTDSGENWVQDISGTSQFLFGIFLTSANIGYAVGSSGTILKSGANPPPPPPPQNCTPVAFYPFNGNANDESGNGNNGTVTGATLTSDRFNNPNKAYLFDNPDRSFSYSNTNSINCGHGSTLQMGNAMSISLWFNSRAGNVFGSYLLNKATTYEYSIGWDVAGFFAIIGGGSNPNQLAISFNPAANTWNHVAVTWQYPGEMKLYVNGVLRNSRQTSQGMVPTNEDLTIGFRCPMCPAPSIRYFDGKIDDIRIYNCSLPDSVIQQLYQEPNACLLTVNAGADTVIYLGYGPQSVTLTATAAGGYTPYSYLWQPGGATDQTITVSPQTTTTYTVQVTNSIGCVVNDEVLVTVYDTRCGNNGNKVLVCHNGHTICISENAVPAHLAHGDQLDSCNGGPDNPFTLNNPIPTEFMLHYNYPNPFNPRTVIKYDIPFESKVTLLVYNILGQEVRRLVNIEQSPGYYSVEFDGSDLGSGIYFYRLSANSSIRNYTEIRKMVLIK
jgi:photosystem II stability/assembly factor-like uncharacterized protein